MNTPVVPIQMGRITVSGALMMALRSREKNTACLERPRLTTMPWLAIWRDMGMNMQK